MKAKDLKNSILQMAVQGKLVPQDSSDESASVLLERIRKERARLIKEKKIKAPKGGNRLSIALPIRSTMRSGLMPRDGNPSQSALKMRYRLRFLKAGNGLDSAI